MTRLFSAIAASVIIAGSAGGMMFMSSAASAQNSTVLSKDASKCEIFRAISRVIPGQCAPGYKARKPLTRSLVRRNVKQAPPAPVVQSKPAGDLAAALSIQFALDSVELTPQAITADHHWRWRAAVFPRSALWHRVCICNSIATALV